MGRKPTGSNGKKRPLTVHLEPGLFDEVSALARITNVTLLELVSDGLRKELTSRLREGGDKLAGALEVAKEYG